MSEEEKREILASLESYHATNLTPAAVVDYLWVFRDSPEEEMREVVREWKFRRSFRDRFPSPADLSVLLQEMRNRAWEKAKRHEAGIDKIAGFWESKIKAFKSPRYREHFRRFLEIFKNVGEIPKEDYLAKMYEMERDFPAFGWEQEANKLKAWWEGNGTMDGWKGPAADRKDNP